MRLRTDTRCVYKPGNIESVVNDAIRERKQVLWQRWMTRASSGNVRPLVAISRLHHRVAA